MRPWRRVAAPSRLSYVVVKAVEKKVQKPIEIEWIILKENLSSGEVAGVYKHSIPNAELDIKINFTHVLELWKQLSVLVNCFCVFD